MTTKVRTTEIEAHIVAEAGIIAPTVDTVCHEEALYSWLSEYKPLMLCGPPGSAIQHQNLFFFKKKKKESFYIVSTENT